MPSDEGSVPRHEAGALRHRMRRLLVLVSFTVFAAVAPALDARETSLREMTLEELLAVEVAVGTGNPQTLSEVPAVVSVITAEQIERMGARRLVDVLEAVPGMHLVPVVDRSLDLAPTVRGLNTSGVQVLLLVDGLPLPQLLIGGPPVGFKLPVTSIERIEVVRGPGSAIFGADALAGVINVVTKKGTDAGSRAGARGGSFGFRNGWLEHSQALGDWNLYVAGDWMESDGDDGRIVERDLQGSLDEAFGTRAPRPVGPAVDRPPLGRLPDLRLRHRSFDPGPGRLLRQRAAAPRRAASTPDRGALGARADGPCPLPRRHAGVRPLSRRSDPPDR